MISACLGIAPPDGQTRQAKMRPRICRVKLQGTLKLLFGFLKTILSEQSFSQSQTQHVRTIAAQFKQHADISRWPEPDRVDRTR
jgi:hypothetical protein